MYGVAVLLYLFIGLFLIVIALPLIKRRVKRNYVYGFRTSKTLRDDSIWYPANEYAGRRLLEAGIVTVLAALVLDFIPGLTIPGYLLCCAATMVGMLFRATISSFFYLRQL